MLILRKFSSVCISSVTISVVTMSDIKIWREGLKFHFGCFWRFPMNGFPVLGWISLFHSSSQVSFQVEREQSVSEGALSRFSGGWSWAVGVCPVLSRRSSGCQRAGEKGLVFFSVGPWLEVQLLLQQPVKTRSLQKGNFGFVKPFHVIIQYRKRENLCQQWACWDSQQGRVWLTDKHRSRQPGRA